MRQIVSLNPAPVRVQQARGATCLTARAAADVCARDQPPADVPSGLPLDTLSAARDHLDVLAHLGCRTWGDVAALPRGGLTRRFGKELRTALDAAYGLRPESHRWLTLPDVFEQKLELPALAEGAPGRPPAVGAADLAACTAACARALEPQWTLDLKRFNGVNLPPHQHITVRTAEATQDMAHLRRLLAEKLALTTLAAPASWPRLRSLETDPVAVPPRLPARGQPQGRQAP